jgi:tRNA1Val (adenine37-N6)-methyltransferase
MPNDYFQFKQFTIQQAKSAMKVCTDACLFGAIVADEISRSSSEISSHNIDNILDIGTGTGLLSLMLAQQVKANIHAVEVDENAFQQAHENIKQSPWNDRITVHHTAIQDYQPTTKYDFIISNPPFFENDLKSEDTKRNLALHSEALTLQELLDNIKRLLTPTGSFAILLPYQRSVYFDDLASKSGYSLQQKTVVKQTEKHQPFRSMLWYATQQTTRREHEIIIRQKENYSKEFISLLKDYYLYL